MPERLQASLAKMLAKDPGRRFQSMSAVHAELKAILQGAEAGPKASKVRGPARVALAAAVLVAVVIGAAWLAKQVFFASAAKALAFQERDWILITDFENLTGDPVFEGSLETALTVGIQQSQYVNIATCYQGLEKKRKPWGTTRKPSS